MILHTRLCCRLRNKNVVTAKYLFVLFIEFTAFILCILLTVIRMKVLGNAAPYVTNQLMNVQDDPGPALHPGCLEGAEIDRVADRKSVV